MITLLQLWKSHIYTCGEQGRQAADTISEVFWDETVKWSVDESEIKSQWL